MRPKGEGGRGPAQGPAPTLYKRPVRGAGSDPGNSRTDDKGGTVRGAVMRRPALRGIPLAEGWLKPGEVTVTMSRGEWDSLLAGAYEAGFILVELDHAERPVAAYQKAGEAVAS